MSTNPELDAACAIAMGWTLSDDGLWNDPRNPGTVCACPCYSTDPKLLNEKMAWMKACDPDFNLVEIRMESHEDEICAMFWDTYGWSREGKGKDIHEATARLISELRWRYEV